MTQTVAIAGLGAIGLPLARALDAGVDGLRLIAVACRDPVKGRANMAGFQSAPRLVEIPELADADIVVEGAPAALFERSPLPALEAGGSWSRPRSARCCHACIWCDWRRQTGARIIVPTGALLGLDAVRAAAEGPIDSVSIETRKPPTEPDGCSLSGKEWYRRDGLAQPLWCSKAMRWRRRGLPSQRQCRRGAGVGRHRPGANPGADLGRSGVTRNIHSIRVEADAARFSMTIENMPSQDNLKTGQLTALSLLACLRGLMSTLKVGS